MSIQEQVFRLEVPIDDVMQVEIIERERNLGRVKLCYRVRKALYVGCQSPYPSKSIGCDEREKEKIYL